jgi:hypothetical protein
MIGARRFMVRSFGVRDGAFELGGDAHVDARAPITVL